MCKEGVRDVRGNIPRGTDAVWQAIADGLTWLLFKSSRVSF